MSATALVVIDVVFHKILNTNKGFMTKNTLEIFFVFMTMYLHSSITSLKILGQKKPGCFIKLVVAVNMVFNFLITDISIMAERSSVPSKVSKCLTTSAFSSNILVQKGQGKLGWTEDMSEVWEPSTPFSLLRCNWLDQIVVNEQNFYTKILTN